MNNYIKIDLHEHFNHKAIGDATAISEGKNLENVSIGGQFLNPDLLPKSLEEVYFNRVPFTFPDKSPEIYDNIACEEQIINISEGCYKNFNILGLSEWGNIDNEL